MLLKRSRITNEVLLKGVLIHTGKCMSKLSKFKSLKRRSYVYLCKAKKKELIHMKSRRKGLCRYVKS